MPFLDDAPAVGLPIATPEPLPVTVPSAPFSRLFDAAMRRDNIVGSITEAATQPPMGAFDPSFDPWAKIGGYEDHARAFIGANNDDDVLHIKARIDKERRDRELMENGGWRGAAALLAAGTMDPVNLIPLGQVRAITRGGRALEGAIRGAAAFGAGTALQEVGLQGTQITRPVSESLMNIGSATVMGGVLGGAVGALTRPTMQTLRGLGDSSSIGGMIFDRELAGNLPGRRNLEEAAEVYDAPAIQRATAAAGGDVAKVAEDLRARIDDELSTGGIVEHRNQSGEKVRVNAIDEAGVMTDANGARLTLDDVTGPGHSLEIRMPADTGRGITQLVDDPLTLHLRGDLSAARAAEIRDTLATLDPVEAARLRNAGVPLDPELWKVIAANLEKAEASREGGLEVVMDQAQYLRRGGDLDTVSEREAFAVINRAMQAEVARGGDPNRFLDDAIAAGLGDRRVPGWVADWKQRLLYALPTPAEPGRAVAGQLAGVRGPIADEVARVLTGVGRPAAEARAYGGLAQIRYETRAARLGTGESAEDLFRRDFPEVARGETSELRPGELAQRGVTETVKTDNTREAARTDQGQALPGRVPTGKDAPADRHTNADAIPDLATLESNERLFTNTVNAVGADPGMGGSRTFASTKEKAEYLIGRIVDNLRWLYDQVPPEIRERSKLWYDGAQAIATEWATRWGKTRAQTAGMLAVLSPQKDWFMNTSMAERIGDILYRQGGHRWDNAMDAQAFKFLVGETATSAENRAAYAAIKDKTLREVVAAGDPVHTGMWLRAYDEAHHGTAHAIITPEGAYAGNVLTGAGDEARRAWGDFGAIGKAASIFYDGSPENISLMIGAEHKVRNFYNNIFNAGDARYVTIDTHAVAADELRPVAGNDKAVEDNFGGTGSDRATGLKGSYALHAEAYRRLAEELGLLPREIQSITWEAVRGLFPDNWKTRANKEAVDAIWNRVDSGELSVDDARAEILALRANKTELDSIRSRIESGELSAEEGRAQINALAKTGGIDPPTWVGQTAAVARTSTYPAERGPPTGAGITFEVAPDPRNAALVERWAAVPRAVQDRISHSVAWQVATRALEGAGEALWGVGGKQRRPVALKGELHRNNGAWLDDSNPSLSLLLDQDISPAKAGILARLLGYALGQEAMLRASPKPFPGGAETGAVKVQLPKDATPAQIAEVWQQIREIADENGSPYALGHTTGADGEMLILNNNDRAATISRQDLARLIDEKLGGQYDIQSGSVYAELVEAGDNAYGLSGGREDAGRVRGGPSQSSIRAAGDTLRAEAQRHLDEQLAAHERLAGGGAEPAAAAGPGATAEPGAGPSPRGPPGELEQAGRGKISLSTESERALITLFRDADASTFGHEISHHWLTELFTDAAHPQAPAALRKHADDVRAWLGIKEGEGISVAAQEKFATGFEQYLRSGQAPTPELASAFRQFREWLVKIYQTITGLGEPISPEVRALFDQFLTVEEKATTPSGAGGSLSAASPHATLDQETIASALGIEKALVRVSPTLRTGTSPSVETRRISMALADQPLDLKKNVEGIPTAQSAESLIKQFQAPLAEAEVGVDDLFTRYRLGRSRRVFDIARLEARDMLGAPEGAMSYAEFRQAIGRAMRRGDQAVEPEVAEAAQLLRRTVFDPLKQRAIDAGLMPEDIDTKTAESYLMRVYDAPKIAAQRGFRDGQFGDVITRWLASEQAKKDTIRTRVTSLLGEYELLQSRAVPRVTRIAEIRDELEDLVTSWEGKTSQAAKSALARRAEAEAERTPEQGRLAAADKPVIAAAEAIANANTRLEEIELRDIARQIIDRILGSPVGRLPYDMEVPHPSGGPPRPDRAAPRGPLAQRSFMIPDELIEPWLESDSREIARMYTRTMAPDVVLAERFGRTDMEAQLQEIMASYERLRQGASEAELTRLHNQMQADLRDIAAMRDRMRGTYALPADPNGLGNRAFHVIRDLNYLRLLGGMTISALPDMGRLVMQHGFSRVFGDAIVPMLSGWGEFRLAAGEAKLSGTAVDMVLDSRAMSMADMLDDYGRWSKYERGLKGLTDRFGLVTLMAPWNSAMKQIAGVIGQTRTLEAIEALVSGQPLRQAERTRLASLGIGPEMAERIDAQFKTHGQKQDNGTWWANSQDWTDRDAIEAFRSALNKEIDTTIVTKGQEVPLWMSGGGTLLPGNVGKMIGQFRSFGLAAAQRVMMAGLQKRDMATLNGALLMVGLGMMVYYIRSVTNPKAQELPDITTPDGLARWLREGVDISGLTGYLFDVHNMIEKASGGGIGISRLTGGPAQSRYANRNTLESILGPTAGLVQDAGQLLGAATKGEWKAGDSSRVRRMIPFQNVIGLRHVFDAAEHGINQAFGIKEPVPPRR